MRIIAAILLSVTAVSAQLVTPVEVNPEQSVDVAVTHKAYGAVTFRMKIDGVDVANHLPVDLGFKAAKGDASFFASTTGTVHSANTLDFDFTGANFATNNTEDITLYGDVRLTSYDLPIPSILLRLKPSFNWGSESYTPPSQTEALPIAGGTMTGNINMGGNNISNVGTGGIYRVNATFISMAGQLDMNGDEILDAVLGTNLDANTYDITGAGTLGFGGMTFTNAPMSTNGLLPYGVWVDTNAANVLKLYIP